MSADARLFQRIARWLLPDEFWHRFGQPLIQAVVDQRRSLSPQGPSRLVAFWSRELAGLVATVARERAEAGRARRANQPPSPLGQKVRHMWHTLLQDLRYAFRMMVKTPAVTAIAIVSLALGVAATTSVYSLYHAWLVRSVPYPNGDRLVVGWERESRTNTNEDLTPATYFAWAEESRSFEQVMALSFAPENITGGDRPEMVWRGEVTPNLFSALAVTPLLGRTFAPGDGDVGSEPVVVIGETLWRERFGGTPDIIGSEIRLDDVVHTVIGVVSRKFDFIQGNVDVWRAHSFVGQRDDRGDRRITLTAYLAPGVTLEQARSDLEGVHDRLRQQFPEEHEGMTVRLVSMRQFFPGPADRAFIKLLMAVVLLVLLVACVNVASLYLAKTEGRRREIAIRAALGAGRWRLVRQLLSETTLLALVAGGLGVALAVPGVAFFGTAMPASLPASLNMPELNGSVIGFGFGAAIVAGLAFGLVPVAQALRTRDHHVLDGSRGGTASRRSKRLRGAFVVGEFAMALGILIGVAALTDLFSRRLSENPGFDGSNVLTARIQLPAYRYGTPDALRRASRELHTELAAIGGVSVTALASTLPRTQGLASRDFRVDGRPAPDGDAMPRARVASVSPGYFDALSITLVRGRGIEPRDRDEAEPVAVISQRLADRFFDGQDPLGQRLTVDSVSYAVVGVVSDVALARLDGLLPADPAIFIPLDQRPVSRLMAVLHSGATDPHLLARPLQEAVWRVDVDQPVAEVLTMEEHVARILAGPIVITQLLLAVGLLALTLAAIGTYGVMSFTVSQERRDTGIRMALGAQPAGVLGRMTGRGACLAGLGLVAGMPLAFLIVQQIGAIMNQEEFGPGAAGQIDIAPEPLIAAALILATVGVLASYLPARRATAIDPARVLGEE